MSKVILLANTFAVTLVFRRSLVTKLHRAGHLSGIFSISRDYQSLGLTEIECFYPKEMHSTWLSWFYLMRDPSVRVIHSFTHLANLLAVCSAIILRKKVVMTVTGMGRAFNHSGLLGSICRFGVRTFYFFAHFFASAIIVQNSDDYRELERLVLKRFLPRLFITAGSGIPLDYFENVEQLQHLPSNDIKIGFFSRALPQKGVAQFYSLALKHSSEQELNFLHVGHPGRKEFHSDRIHRTAQSSNVSYFGSTLDLRPWLLAVDIVVIPSSYREGLSRLFIESMLAGKIVVAKSTSGVSDHITTGVNGFLYRKDEDLDSAFERALRALGSSMHLEAREYAKNNFDVEKVDQVYFRAYSLADFHP